MKGWNLNRLFTAFAKRFVRRDTSTSFDCESIEIAEQGAPVSSKAGSCSQTDTRVLRQENKGRGLFRLLFGFALLIGSASTAFAGTFSCGPTTPPENADFQLLDGFNLQDVGLTLTEFDNLASLSFVGNCTIKDFPEDNGIGGFGNGSTLLNFNLPNKDVGATIVMDNVYYNGNFSCNNLPDTVVVWWVNGSWNSIDSKCQAFMPPQFDGLRKLNPASETTQAIGVPFTYTLTASEMVDISPLDGSYSWTGTPGTDDLTYVRIEDDLTATATGADLSYVSHNAYLVDSAGNWVSDFTFDIAPTFGDTNLIFQKNTPIDTTVVVPAGQQLVVELTVVLEDTPANTPGTAFSNEVDWYLSKSVYTQHILDNGLPPVRIENVPGHTDATAPMTIVGPYLQVSKSSPVTTMSAGESALFTVDAYNTGEYDAWDSVIVDQLPAGMCFNDPTTSGFTVEHVDTVGTSTTVDAANYTLEWLNGGTTTTACEIRLTTTGVKLAPQEHLVINYNAVLDTAPLSGVQFTNVASADYWYTADSTVTTRKEYYEPATDGTIGDDKDSEDAHTITAAAPYLQVSKSSTSTTLSIGPPARYTINVYNNDDGSAWDPIISDHLPPGMCGTDVSNFSVELVDTDGTTVLTTLLEGGDPGYTLNLAPDSAPFACQFTLTTTNVEIGPQQRLKIYYDAQLDAGVTSGDTFTNVASADYWYNADSSVGTRTEYEELATDGTTADDTDSEDAYTLTAAVAGYYFLKTVENLTTGQSPATSAFPGDTLRYTLRLQNYTQPELDVTSLTDTLSDTYFDLTSIKLVAGNTFPVTPTITGGVISFAPFTLGNQVGVDDDYEIQFDVTLDLGLSHDLPVPNEAKLSGTYDTPAIPLTDALSDDPNQSGPVELLSSVAGTATRQPTLVTIQAPEALAKAGTQPTATIGEKFTYTITVPASPVDIPLYDVKVIDDLRSITTNAVLEVVQTETSAQLLSGAQSWPTLDISVNATGETVLEDAVGGIDIPAGDQAVFTLTVILDNDKDNQSGNSFTNSATYTFNKKNGDDTTEGDGQAGSTLTSMTVLEPELKVVKGVENVTAPGEPAQAGQTLLYTVDITNDATATASPAYDISIADTLPANVLLDEASVTATIVGSGVSVTPATTTINGTKVWGNQNGDDTLDIGVGETLRLTYKVFVLSTDGTDLVNSVYVDWTSLDGVQTYERTGDGCPTLTAPDLNDYCSAEAFATIQTTDTNSIVKTIIGDSNIGDTSTPPVLRVGDTVTYQLAVQLHEGITPNVLVQDILPAGMQLTGAPTYSTSAGANFVYSLTTTPAVLDNTVDGTIVWDFGDVNNQSDTIGFDEILIEYTAVVVTDPAPTGVDHVPSLTDISVPTTTNHATLAYTGGDPASSDQTVYDRLNSEALLDIHQPVMTPIAKDAALAPSGTPIAVGDGLLDTSAYEVDVVNDTLRFTLESCNATGLAPAYNLAIRDTLPVQMDLASMVGPVVKVGANLASAVAVTEGAANDYVYTLSGSVMDFTFTDNRPIAPNECVFVQYDIGFDANIAPNTTWNNTAQVVNYWSLPSTATPRREYTQSETDSVYMTNTANLLPPTKAITQPNYPTDTTVTIGEQVIYTITIPATNATLTNVLVEDNLNLALTYTAGDATVSGGLSFTDNSSGPLFSITIDSIPAGQEVVITLPVQVVDDPAFTAGYSFDNQASYTYNGTTYTSLLAGALTIVEPALVPSKSVTPPPSDPVAGDTLTYTITIPAQDTTTNLNTSPAYDLTVVDTLGGGLLYVGGTAQFNGMSPGTTEPTLGTDVTGTLQTLTWADLDIPYNTEVTITYQVLVQDSVVPNQLLTNTANFEWSSLDTVVSGERTYTATDSTTLTVADTASLTKAVVADSYVDANPAAPSTADDSTVRIGDTVDYQLTLNLQEGTTQGVQVSDNLHATHAALAFESVSVSTGTGITYSTDPVSVNWDSTNGTVTFTLGDVVHTPDADTDDAIVITYRVRVLKDTLAHQATITPITNAATLDYTGAPATTPARLQSSADITVVQPVIASTSLTKTDRNGLTSPAQIDDVANTTMGFRLEACNSGAAPAYNMTVTDVLNATYFDVTSINNVAVFIGGTETFNYVYNSSSLPTMTFTVNDPVYPGQCVDIDFDIGFRTDFGANQTWNNTFEVSEYWSLQQPEPGTDAFAQLYTPVTLPIPFEMTNNANITPPFKELLSPVEATIGEEVVYQITVPTVANDASTMYDVAITDPLDGNLEYVSANVTCPTCIGVNNTSTVGGSSLNIVIDQIPPGERAIIELHARVRNVLSAQDVAAIDNTVSYTYANAAGGTPESGGSSSQLVTVNIVEPNIGTFTKTADKTSATAGEIVRYSVTLTADSGADLSDVFDVTLTDTLDEGLAYAGNPTVTVGTSGVSVDNFIGAPVTSGDGSTGNPQKLIWDLSNSDIDINEGETVIVSYDVLVLDNVLANQTLRNSVVAQWTGRDGAYTTPTDYERDGSDGATGLNNYITAAVWADITIPDTNSITKEWMSDTYADGAANVRIGDTVDYTLTLSLQEGTLDNLVLIDTLPQGLEFAGIVSINGNTGPTYTAVAPFSHADITSANVSAPGDARAGETTVTWSLDTVTNTQNDGANDDFVIVYRARVLNNVFLHSELNKDLNNRVTMSYDTATGRVTQSDIDTVITALQPELTVTKTALGANGDTIVEAGEVVTYTVNLQNTGTAPAYDVVLQDIVPLGMRAGGVTMVSTFLDSTPLVALAPAYNTSTGVAVWNFDDGNAPSSYTIPAGGTLQVVYSVTVDSDIGAGLTLTNSAQATSYYSLNNDDVSPVDSAIYRETYTSNTATASVTTAAAGALSKATTQPSAAIGEEFTYIITVPQTTVSTALHDVHVYDNLAASEADLSFVGATVVPGGDWTGTLDTSVDAAGLVTIRNVDPGGIEIPANAQIQIEITVKLLNTAKNLNPGLSFANRAWYTYSNGVTTLGDFPTTGATSGSMTVAHPSLTMTKSGPLPAEMQVGGAPATFTLDAENTSTSVAWNVTVTDWLPNPTVGGMCDAGVTNVSATVRDSGGNVLQTLTTGTEYSTSFTVSATEPRCEFVVTTTGVDIEPTEHLVVTYDAALDTDNIDGTVLTNIAGATRWFSARPATGVFNTYTAVLTTGTVGTADHEDAYMVTALGAVLTSQKTVQNITTGLSGENASPGDTLRYTVTIQNTTTSQLTNFSLVDELDRLNASPMFAAGTLTFVTAASTLSSSAVVNVDANGGSKGTGLLDISSLDIGPSETLTAVFDVALAPVITSGTIVYNQGQLTSGGTVFGNTDDPALPNPVDPTETTITSAPQFQVYKTSADITGDTNVLVAGDTIRYTITVKNIGSEDAVNVSLRDTIPNFTTYVANSTYLNGVAVADNAGVSPLQGGMLINAPENTTPGYLRADASATTSNVATITFDVVTNLDVLDGTFIDNQAFINGAGAGSGPFVERASDDNLFNGADDPAVFGDEDITRDIVGNLPWLDATKTAALQTDLNSNGAYDTGDTIRYTITVNNFGDIPATGVSLMDGIPTGTSYVAGTTRMDGVLVADPAANVSALASGMPINPAGSISGTVPAGASVVVTFDVLITATSGQISNQGYVSSNELVTEPTDADGNDANNDQPTIVFVGSAQQVSIAKNVSVVGGGAALPGGTLEYVVEVSNTGATTATTVVITDNLAALSGIVTYVANSAKLNGVLNSTSVTYDAAAQILTANVGDLAVGESTVLSFQVLIDNAAAEGTLVNNTAQVDWNTPTLTATASADIYINGIPGYAILGGNVWHDPNFSNDYDPTEQYLAGWTVEIYRNNALLGSTTTDADGHYQFNGLTPTVTAADQYELRFTAPGAVATTAKLGLGYYGTAQTLQQISNIDAVSGSNIQNLNLLIRPNGVVYDSISRTPIAGATLTMVDPVSQQALPSSCFDDPAQQGQVTLADGFYRFDMNFSDPACPAGGDYLISVTPPSTAYEQQVSRVIPPLTDASTPAFSVPGCLGSTSDAVLATTGICEVVSLYTAPPTSVQARTAGTNYYLHLTLNNNQIPGENQLFNNHIAIDPILENVVSISKLAGRVSASRGEFVPYTITVNNGYYTALQDLTIVDTFPPGFKYVEGSSRYDGQPLEPVLVGGQLRWENIDLATDTQHTIKLLFIVGSGVSEGDYVNRAQVINAFTGSDISGEATATVRVVPDPNIDCTDVIGKVFDDANLNGYQDEGETGLPGVRLVSARGLLITTDEHGRFHVTCAVVPNESRGSNYILKLDDRSLPTGYRVTSENPRVQRVTRGKMIKFNFGATIHHVVRLDVGDGVFEPDSTTMRQQWTPRIPMLIEELKKGPSVLRLSYLADVEDEGLVRERVNALKDIITEQWDALNCCYKLTIESEVYWRRGAPPERSGVID